MLVNFLKTMSRPATVSAGLTLALVCTSDVTEAKVRIVGFEAPNIGQSDGHAPATGRQLSDPVLLAQSDCGCDDAGDEDEFWEEFDKSFDEGFEDGDFDEDFADDYDERDDDQEYDQDYAGESGDAGDNEFWQAFEEGFEEGLTEHHNEGYAQDYQPGHTGNQGSGYANSQRPAWEERLNRITAGERRVWEAARDIQQQGSYDYYGPAQ